MPAPGAYQWTAHLVVFGWYMEFSVRMVHGIYFIWQLTLLLLSDGFI